jgi:cytochrome oxidase Cu insertion factor (SCO1/SenC/PrrC family)
VVASSPRSCRFPKIIAYSAGLGSPPARLIGLTGIRRDVRKIALAYKAYYARKENGRGEDYTTDRTGVTYLVGPERQYLCFALPQTTPGRPTEVIRAQLGN